MIFRLFRFQLTKVAPSLAQHIFTKRTMSATDLSQFLQFNKDKYLKDVGQGKGRDWTVVMGNEAGDLDSIASSLAYSWFATTINSSPTVALVQTPRTDLKLRAENLYAFELAKLDKDCNDLLCIDDIPPSSLNPFSSNKFALVDHNRLLSRYSDNNEDVRVVAVVDHHEDEGLYKDTAEPRIIQVPTGSCTSLITRLLQQSVPDGKIPLGVATLLLCGILIDTGGLKAGGKAEAVDRESAAFLVPQVEISSFNPLSQQQSKSPKLEDIKAIQDLTQQLFDKKAAVSHLSTIDLLRRDYKEYNLTCSWVPDKAAITVGLSTVPLGLKTWLPKEGDNFWTSADKYMIDRQLTILGILTSFRETKKISVGEKTKHKRQVLFIIRLESAEGSIEGLEKRLWDGLENNKELKLEKRSLSKFSGVWKKGAEVDLNKARAYKQGNTNLTRKFIAPLVKNIIEGQEPES